MNAALPWPGGGPAWRAGPAEATAKTPFIMVTAESKPENVLAAQKAGVNNYLVKPFSAPVLKDKIDKALSGEAA